MTEQPKFRRLSADDLVPEGSDKYVDVGLVSYLSKVAWGRPIILKGPKGAGKSLAVKQWAHDVGVPVVEQPCTSYTSIKDLVGACPDVNTPFTLGALTAAIDIANEDGACVLLLEEINALDPDVQKKLNSLTDFRQSVSVPRLAHNFRVDAGKKVWVIGTMNPNYAGTYGLNEDLLSRVWPVLVNYMPPELEKKVMLDELGRAPTKEEVGLVTRLRTFADETRGDNELYALSTRDLVGFIDFYKKLGLDLALKQIEGKYDDTEQVQDIRARIMTSFSVNLEKVRLYSAPSS